MSGKEKLKMRVITCAKQQKEAMKNEDWEMITAQGS